MNRKLFSTLAAAALAMSIFAPVAIAQPPLGACTVGTGLGSTLLVPFFEVDLNDPNGVTTLISVANGLSDPTLTRVVLWTDWGVPTIAFDIYLEGFEVEPINVRSLLNGNLPSSGTGADLSGFDFCDILPPFHDNPILPQDEQDQLAADHTGQPGPIFSDCAGETHDDGIARGYITIDVVDECSGVEGSAAFFTPANAGDVFPFFVDGGSSDGIGIIDNRLWGEVVYVDFVNNSAQGSEALTLWADSTLFSGTDIFTFYGSLSGNDGRDDRVPLPTQWNQRFLNGGLFSGGANLIVFRDLGTGPEVADCDEDPTWKPLTDSSQARDQDAGNLFDIGTGANFPVATQRIDVADLAIPYDFGWVEIDTGDNLGSWIQPSLTAGGLFSAGYNGAATRSLCAGAPTPPAITSPDVEEKVVAPAAAVPSKAARDKRAYSASFRTLRSGS